MLTKCILVVQLLMVEFNILMAQCNEVILVELILVTELLTAKSLTGGGWRRRWLSCLCPAIPTVHWWWHNFGFLISLSRRGRRRILAPLGLEWLIHRLGVGKLEIAHFSWDDGALMLRFEFGYQPSL